MDWGTVITNGLLGGIAGILFAMNENIIHYGERVLNLLNRTKVDLDAIHCELRKQNNILKGETNE